MARIWRSYLAVIFGTTLLALAVRFYVIEAYRIPTPIMQPTLEPGDVIFAFKPPFGFRFPGVQKSLFGGRVPRYGEVVVFSSPSALTSIDSIRRVIGLPGDSVGVASGRPIVNGKLLDFEPDAAGPCGRETSVAGPSYRVCLTPPLMEDQPADRVPPGSIFVLGDFRQHVSESQATAGVNRNWAVIPAESVQARALWIWLSMDPERARIRRERLFKKIQ